MKLNQFKKIAVVLLGLFAFMQSSQAQRYYLFAPEVKSAYPSIVYDFLESYLYEIDSLQRRGAYIDQKLRDDKVFFIKGTPHDTRRISSTMAFEIKRTDNKFYEVLWTDSLGQIVLDLAFPMQYELLLGKPKVEMEKDFKATLLAYSNYSPTTCLSEDMILQEDSCLMSNPVSNYYVESLNTATYYNNKEGLRPTFSNTDKWHSATNLFHGCIDCIDDYVLYIEQNLYGFKKISYSIPLFQWLAYCQSMKLNTYFAIEEEREDGMKALLIAQSSDLGFNHMMSLIIPDCFVDKRNTVIKATLNAYIPTQNVKDLYQQYVDKPKKKI